MTDKPDTGPRTFDDEELSKLWEAFRSGGVAHCPRDKAPLALAVDAAAKSYRLVCTQCGSASLWFETAPTGIHVRSSDDSGAPGASDD
jgi:hypothetical protein